MVTISHIVKKIIEEQPMLREPLANGIINYAALAEKLKPQIEKELGIKVKETAIIMALRRYSEELSAKEIKNLRIYFDTEIVLKNNIVDISIAKTPELFRDLEKLHKAIGYEKGTLNIIQGNNEVSLITNEKSFSKVMKVIEKDKITDVVHKLASVSMGLSKEYLHTPGIIAELTRKLAWNNINIYEIISTNTEITLILSDKDAIRAYDALSELAAK